MRSMFAAALAELAELQAPRGRLLVLCLRIIPFFAFTALERDDFPHCLNLLSPLKGLNLLLHFYPRLTLWALIFSPLRRLDFVLQHRPVPCELGIRYSALGTVSYAMISLMVPAPTVRPPSRIAKRKPFSIATGVISSTTKATLSPGITISVPAGSSATPVTSVVRK